MYYRITECRRGTCKLRDWNCCCGRGRQLPCRQEAAEGPSPVCRAGQDASGIPLTPRAPPAQPQPCTMAPRTHVPRVPSPHQCPAHGWMHSTHTVTFSNVCLEPSQFLLDHVSMQTQDPLSPGCIRRRSGVNGIIHVLKTTRTLELFLRQRCCCVSSPNHLSICTYSTSHEVHRTAVNINNGNIKAPFQVQDCKWYFYLLLSTYLFIKCIRKSIKEEIKDLRHHSNPVFQIQTLNVAQPLHLILSYDSVEVGSRR